MLFSFREERHRYLRAYYVSIMVPGPGKRVANQRTRTDLLKPMISGTQSN